MPLVQGPEGVIEFPDDMSTADIEAAMQKTYPPVSENMDMLKSAAQGGRDVLEGLAAAPGEVDKLEQSVLSWLKNSAGDAPILQGTGMEGVPKRFAENWEAVSKKLLPDVPMPTHDDVQWTEKQLGLPDQYKPQTDAGNIARYGTAGLAGAAIGGPAISSFGKFAAAHLPAYASRLIQGALLGGGAALGHEAFKAAKGPSTWTPYR